MTAPSRPSSLSDLDPFAPVPWVGTALGPVARDGEPFEKEGVQVRTRAGSGMLWICATVRDCQTMDERSFQAAVSRCYVIALELVQAAELKPFRIWNFIPDIRRPSDDGYSRYEIFNAGRQQSHRELVAGESADHPVTASGVGHPGPDFVVQVLAGVVRGVPVENPRQCPSYHYSVRYGPQPPHFSRASRFVDRLGELPWPRVGLVSGTASIVGEDSTHEGDLAGQLEETFLNLAIVASEVTGRPVGPTPDAAAVAELLGCYDELRVYVLNESDVPEILDAFSRAFPAAARVDLVCAQLCRPELLVETEGVLHWEP